MLLETKGAFGKTQIGSLSFEIQTLSAENMNLLNW